MQDFSGAEIERFIKIWHEEAFHKERDRAQYEQRLQMALRDSAAIRELAANPLLLTMMAILNRVQDLPRDRGRLYERCAELLLKNWDLDKFPERTSRKDTRDIKDKLGPDQKMRILELAAAAMQSERTGLAGNIIGEDKLKEIVQNQLAELEIVQPWAVAEDLIALLRERNFMLAYLGDHQYAFVHRTFLEYFAARDLKYRLEKTSTFTIEQLVILFRERWSHDEWQEIMRLLCGMIGPEYAANCISELAKQRNSPGGEKAVLLAGDCIREVRELRAVRDVRSELRDSLRNLTKLDGGSKEVNQLQKTFEIRSKALELLAQGWREEPETLDWFKKELCVSPNTDVRMSIVSIIGRYWKEEPWTLPWLKERAMDADHIVRSAALMELGSSWGNDSSVTAFMKANLAEEENPMVLMIGSVSLSAFCNRDPEAKAFTRILASQGKEPYLRSFAIKSLASLYERDPESLALIKERAASDSEPSVRQSALKALAGWANEPGLAEWLTARTVQEADEEVRATAIEILTAAAAVTSKGSK